MKTGIAILTHVPEEARPEVAKRLCWCLRTLNKTLIPDFVCIVDDGSANPSHLEYLAYISADVKVVRSIKNRGIARAKNTCIRLLMESGCDICFIAEDDLSFHDRLWVAKYTDAIQVTGMKHLSWSWDLDPDHQWRCHRRINNFLVCETSRVNGSLLVFTPEVVEKVGGFKVLPAPWGHEHTNWTRRIIAAGLTPFFADIAESNQYVSLGPYSSFSSIGDAEKTEYRIANESPANEIDPIYQPLTE